ncbi:hypothetical protein AGMMS49992_26140 [Clostridia bacterium]|nr:hypothetical protein AGMMS49992_26140 [Clostridia bacterium]
MRETRMNETIAPNKRNAVSRFIFGMGVAYLLFLAWAVLWKCGVPFIGDGTKRAVNLLPFNKNTLWELQFNIVVFLPFGFYFAAAKPELSPSKKVLATFFTSLILEVIQFVLSIGRSDVTDLLMNTFGGIVGIAAYYLLSKLFGKYVRKLTLMICILLTLFELYMTVSFILYGKLNIGLMVIKIARDNSIAY